MDDNNLFNTGKGLNIAHLNVRSLMGGKKADLLRHQINNSGIDIFTVSESWLTKAIPYTKVGPSNYVVTRVDREWGSVGKGGSVDLYKKGNTLLRCKVQGTYRPLT